MPKLSKDEIQYLLIIVERYIKELEETIAHTNQKNVVALCAMHRENATIVRSKLNRMLHPHAVYCFRVRNAADEEVKVQVVADSESEAREQLWNVIRLTRGGSASLDHVEKEKES